MLVCASSSWLLAGSVSSISPPTSPVAQHALSRNNKRTQTNTTGTYPLEKRANSLEVEVFMLRWVRLSRPLGTGLGTLKFGVLRSSFCRVRFGSVRKLLINLLAENEKMFTVFSAANLDLRTPFSFFTHTI